jgi:hypothetical protein
VVSERLGRQAREALQWATHVKSLMVRSESPEATLALELLRRDREKMQGLEDQMLNQAALRTQSAGSA